MYFQIYDGIQYLPYNWFNFVFVIIDNLQDQNFVQVQNYPNRKVITKKNQSKLCNMIARVFTYLYL